MLQESPVIPHNLAQVLWFVLASSIGWTGAEIRSWLARRKREPVELDKVRAETRQINASTDVNLTQVAMEALNKAIRLHDERDHWEQKAVKTERKVSDLQRDLAQAETQERMLNAQIKQMKAAIDTLTAILDENKIDYPHWDYVNRKEP